MCPSPTDHTWHPLEVSAISPDEGVMIMENWGIVELGPGMGEAVVWLLTSSDLPEATRSQEVSGMRDAAGVPV